MTGGDWLKEYRSHNGGFPMAGKVECICGEREVLGSIFKKSNLIFIFFRLPGPSDGTLASHVGGGSNLKTNYGRD